MSDIKFYIPEGETIPTNLRLIVDGIHVIYQRIDSGFRFDVSTSDKKTAMNVVKKIVNQMIEDHDDSKHGVSWRTVSLEFIEDSYFGFMTMIEWKYRVRDIY